MPSKPVERSLKHLRDHGWTCAVVERWKPVFDKKTKQMRPYGVRVDAFGFGDILACRSTDQPGEQEITLVQATDGTNFAKHKVKILTTDEFRTWKYAGGTVRLHGWSKQGPRGKRKLWQLREEFL